MPFICPGGREIDGPGAALVADQGRDPQLNPDEFASALEKLGVLNCVAASLARDATGIVSYDFCRLCAHRLGKKLDQIGRHGFPLQKT